MHEHTTIITTLHRVMLSCAVAAVLAGCAACGPYRAVVHESAPGYPPGHGPYVVDGRCYFPVTDAAGFVETGIASWYGPDFHGKTTTSGETYNMYGLTAAHKTLPMGTRLLVTNLENGRSIEVRVNDRGPFVRGRIIDLTRRAAEQLDLIQSGTAPVRIQAMSTGAVRTAGDKDVARQPVVSEVCHGPFAVQVGAFQDRDNAFRMKGRLEEAFQPAHNVQVYSDGDYYRVRLGDFQDLLEAWRTARQLKLQGYADAFVMELDR